jgi:hypothetical protein
LRKNLGMDAYCCSLYGERFRQKDFINNTFHKFQCADFVVSSQSELPVQSSQKEEKTVDTIVDYSIVKGLFEIDEKPLL